MKKSKFHEFDEDDWADMMRQELRNAAYWDDQDMPLEERQWRSKGLLINRVSAGLVDHIRHFQGKVMPSQFSNVPVSIAPGGKP